MDMTLREWRISDVESVAFHANNQKIAANLRDGFPFPYTKKDAESYIVECILQGDNRQLCRAIVDDGQAVGSVGVFLGDNIYRKNGEIGYWLGEAYWGKGIMTNAVKSICTSAFDHFDINRIYAEPFAHNTGSRRVLEKCGFRLEGTLLKNAIKNGKTFDSCVYAVLREEWPAQ